MTVHEAAADAARINDYLRHHGYITAVPSRANPAAYISTLPYGRVATFPDPLTVGLPADQAYEVVYCDHNGTPLATVSGKPGSEVLEIIQRIVVDAGLPAMRAAT